MLKTNLYSKWINLINFYLQKKEKTWLVPVDLYAWEINSTEIDIAKIENNLLNWTIPKQNVNSIYMMETII